MKKISFNFYMSKYSFLQQIYSIFIVGLLFFSFMMPAFNPKSSVNAVGAHIAAQGCVQPVNQANGALWGWGTSQAKSSFPACTSIDTGSLGFQIPSLGDILTFAIRAFFVIAGIAALFYMLIGAFSWVTSGGDKDAVTAAREKIQAAVIGMILIVAVLAIIWTLEQVVFKRRICLGLSCPLTMPGLIERTGTDYCCVCVNQSDNTLGQIVNTSKYKCDKAGQAIDL